MSESKPRIREVIVVEGRYDKNTLSQVVDALIFETGGFSVFHNRKKLETLRMLAEARGLIILTDSDNAGFLIRSKLKGMLPEDKIRQAFIPAIEGKEKSISVMIFDNFVEKGKNYICVEAFYNIDNNQPVYKTAAVEFEVE